MHALQQTVPFGLICFSVVFGTRCPCRAYHTDYAASAVWMGPCRPPRKVSARSTPVGAAAVGPRDRKAYHVVSGRALLGMSKPVPAYVPVMAGAVAATAVALLVGWPGRPPLTDTAAVAAAVASGVVAVLFILGIAAAASPSRTAGPRARSPDLRRA